MLKIEHLTKIYGEKKAVDDLSLHIRPGEIYGFIGHNGAGKTTTIKSCCGILQSDSGEVYIDGKTWTARSQSGAVIAAETLVTVIRMEGVKLYVDVPHDL